MTKSLAYRKNEALIKRGKFPAKYTRILPYVTGQRVVELGSAEGVLAIAMAKAGKQVTAIEKNPSRHHDAKKLADHLGAPGVKFINGGIQTNLGALEGADMLVAVRSIYYLGDEIDAVFAEVARHVPTVVLCGNRNRADAWRAGRPHEPLGEMNRYAASEGMTELLLRHGYTITDGLTEGDEIVVGTMVRPAGNTVQD